MKRIFSGNQFRWAMLLLATTVILPTVCLLWFMIQAVKNERLVMRQKLVEVYQKEIQKQAAANDTHMGALDMLAGNMIQTSSEQGHHPCKTFGFCLDLKQNGVGPVFNGFLVYDPDGEIEYPMPQDSGAGEFDLSETFARAWAFEYTARDYDQAITEYREIEKNAANDFIRRSAIIGQARCLRRQGKRYDAWFACFEALQDVSSGRKNAPLYEPVQATQSATIPLLVQARILRIEILKEMLLIKDPDLQTHRIDYYAYDNQVHDLFTLATDDYSAVSKALPAEKRIYLLHKFLEFTEDPFFQKQLGKYPTDEEAQERRRNIKRKTNAYISIARKRIPAEQLALSVAESYPKPKLYGKRTQNIVRKIEALDDTYAFFHTYNDKTYVILIHPQVLQSEFQEYTGIFEDSSFDYQIFDSNDSLVAGIEHPDEQTILEAGLGEYMPSWNLRVYFKNSSLFEKAAKRQQYMYFWITALMILLVFAAAGGVLRTVGRQIKTNRLKNDFVATVTHELKTPLASTRLLVDTLLENDCKDPPQTREYLELIAKENHRLGRLIDNFLTFSRMERNKQAFDMAQTNPVEIVRAAADAVQAKFDDGNCSFTMSIQDNLPTIPADKDAMVTVLVNLLDNAYKYSHQGKQIEFRIHEQDSFVCFSVKDNGIGMTRRQIKRIFERFYQTDSTLARQVEGTGLGLSIVKFIVDAHKGHIDVESKPGAGSRFTARLPI